MTFHLIFIAVTSLTRLPNLHLPGCSVPADSKHGPRDGPDGLRGTLPDLLRGRVGPHEEAEEHPHVLAKAVRL